MKILLIFLTISLIFFQTKERLTLRQLKKSGIQSIESYHSQWLGLSVLWLVASGFFALAYHRSIVSGQPESNQLYISLFYLLIALIYISRSFSKDIVAPDYLWTSKGKILWKDVQSYRFSQGENPNHIFLEVTTSNKTIVMKFFLKDQGQIESLIESVYKKFNF